MREHTTTGDGLITGLGVFGVMAESGVPLSQLAGLMSRFPQAIENISVTAKPPLSEMEATQNAINTVETELGQDGRVLVRYSGTQMLARVMVEGPTDEIVDRAVTTIATAMRKDIG
jgi:phosphoglucosamine mutase